MGPGKQCEDINCNCVCANVVDEDPIGACCRQDADGYCCTPYTLPGGGTGYECRESTYFNCEFGTGPRGVWKPTLSECNSICGVAGLEYSCCRPLLPGQTAGIPCGFYDFVFTDASQTQQCLQLSGTFCYPSFQSCVDGGGVPSCGVYGQTNTNGCGSCSEIPCNPSGPDVGGYGGGGYGIVGNITSGSGIIPGTVCLDDVRRSICTSNGGFFSPYATCNETTCDPTSGCPECNAPNAWVCAGGECRCRVPLAGDNWSSDCTICTTCVPTSLTASELKNIKIYINSSDYVCVPTICADCLDMEICE